jgi:chemotaxis protein MotA
MLALGSFALLLGCVFGSYIVSGGSFDVLVEALPFELWTIGGAAIASFIMANSLHELKHALGGFKKILAGASFKKSDYVDLLTQLAQLAGDFANFA